MIRLRASHLVPLAVLALAAGLPAAATPAAAATTTYTITNLGSLGGGYTVGAALNNNGQVTGYADTAATITFTCGAGKHRTTCTEHPYHAFVWSNGTMTDLGTLGGADEDSAGKSINLSGEVVGWAQTTTAVGRPCGPARTTAAGEAAVRSHATPLAAAYRDLPRLYSWL